MSSHDGLHWSRQFMEAFIRPGLDPLNWGSAHGNQTPAWHVRQTSPTELSIYWIEHYDPYNLWLPGGLKQLPKDEKHPIVSQFRRGTLRLDGFVSVNAPYAGGEIVTRLLKFQGKELVMNFSTSAVGSITVEIQDEAGKPIPGFSLADCQPIWGDEIERIVGWKGGHDLNKLSGRSVRLRFVMKDADLYAIRFRP
jgi:hypothetical protein